MNRTGKSIRNIYFGLLFQVISTVLSFITRKILVHVIGIELLGINGLFTEVISALSLAELGIGSSIAYSLYKPISEHDEYKICQLMQLYKHAYRVIAGVTLFVGLGLTPWINYLIKDVEIELNYIRIVYVLFVIQLSVSYLFSYKVALLNVDQKNYIYSKIATIIKIVGTCFQIGIVLVTHNYLLYLIMMIAISLSTNIICSKYVDQQYAYLKTTVRGLNKQEKSNIFKNMRDIFIKSVSGKITGSTDNILISTLVSTTLVGYYSNYNLVLNFIRTIVAQIYAGVFNSIGDMMASENNEKCEKVFLKLNYAVYLLGIIFSACTLTCMEPFISLWLGTEYLLSKEVLLICCLMIYMEIICKPLWLIMEVSGLFAKDKYASIVGSGVNLIVSIILGIKLGIIGIFIGTCSTYIIQMLLKAYFLYHYRWKRSVGKYYFTWFCKFSFGVLLMAVSEFICSKILIDNYLIQFMVNGIVTAGIVVVANVAVSFRSDEFRYFKDMILGKALGSFRRDRLW